MWNLIFDSVWGWIGVAGVVVIGCVVVGYLFPSLRAAALAVAGAALTLAGAYAKGNRDRAALEQRRKDEAVRQAKEKYDAIDKRPDTSDDVAKRMRRGGF